MMRVLPRVRCHRKQCFLFQIRVPQDLVDTFPGSVSRSRFQAALAAGGRRLIASMRLFTAEAVVHFSGQPAVCVNRLDGSVIQDRGEVVWNNIADGTVAGSFDGTAMDGVPDGDVVPAAEIPSFPRWRMERLPFAGALRASRNDSVGARRKNSFLGI